ncbi:lysophospholipid acyltransferase family protein [Elusimicrobiota bacterium]
MRTFFLSALFTFYVRIVGWTNRITYFGEEDLPIKPFIYIFWHSKILFVTYTHRGRAIRVLVSTSKDGNVSNNVNRKFGHRIIRGTTSNPKDSRKALLLMLKSLRDGNVLAITPDGPKGPRGEVKTGIPYLAKKQGCALVPVAYSASNKIILNTWDRILVPLPFGRIVSLTGKPIYIHPEQDLQEAAALVKSKLNEITERADRLLLNR